VKKTQSKVSPLICLFSRRYNPLWLYFHSPVAGFSLLVFEVSWSHTKRRATVGRTPLDECSIRRRDLYLTTHNIHKRQTSMPPVGFFFFVKWSIYCRQNLRYRLTWSNASCVSKLPQTHVQFLLHELMCMDYVFLAGSRAGSGTERVW